MNNIEIRLENRNEYRKVEELVRDSFWNVYRPGCLEHYVLMKMRNSPDFVPELDFVMYMNGELIGQNVFVKTSLKCDDGSILPIMTMGPICIRNDLKRKGYGKILLDYSLEKAVKIGCGAVCFEGNIDFYGKSGFTYARDYGVRYHGLPDGEDSSFFLCKELKKGYLDKFSGEYSTPQIYFCGCEESEELEKYDMTFPYKEKLVLPGQLG